jgi:hypothetical protein
LYIVRSFVVQCALSADVKLRRGAAMPSRSISASFIVCLKPPASLAPIAAATPVTRATFAAPSCIVAAPAAAAASGAPPSARGRLVLASTQAIGRAR